MESGRGAPAEVKESDAIVEKRRTANKACSQYVPMRVMREQETGILNMMLPTAQPVPLADMAPGLRLRPIGVAGAAGIGLELIRLLYRLRAIQSPWAPLFQQEQAVTVTRRQVKVMQDDQHRGAAISKCPNGLERGVLMQGVEH